jgi:ABC-2 type transport system ATP-binding protein
MAEAAPSARSAVAPALLELASVTKRYGARTAVERVSLRLCAGEVLGLLGPNGAGKTTLLRMAVDLLRPDEGSVQLFGSAPGGEHGAALLAQVGYLPEERGLPARPRALELLTYLGELKGLARSEARVQARALLQRVQLEARETSRVGELSKGNQQKVQIAAALVGQPRLLLVDEPFSGLDPVNRQLAVELFQAAVRDGAALLLSTHQLHQVHTLCDRLLLVHRGKPLIDGPVQEVRARFADGSVLVRGAPGLTALPQVVRAQPVDGGVRLWLAPGATARELLRAALDAELRLDAFEAHLPSVEEIFVQLVSAQEAAAPVAEVLS